MEETIEEIILRHSSRGMTYLAPLLPVAFCMQAARDILSWPTGTVLLLTGFDVGGEPETDGPTGTYVMARALADLGYRPVVVSEPKTCAFFSSMGIATHEVLPREASDYMDDLLVALSPVGIISIERCGRNCRGKYCNMRGKDISAQTSPVDELVLCAARNAIPTIGVGDGGNEIGMGNVSQAISDKLALEPCSVPVNHLVIATVSNWGAYGIVRALGKCSGKQLLPDFEHVKRFYQFIVDHGSVDGTTGKQQVTVDGFSMDVERSIVEALRRA